MEDIHQRGRERVGASEIRKWKKIEHDMQKFNPIVIYVKLLMGVKLYFRSLVLCSLKGIY